MEIFFGLLVLGVVALAAWLLLAWSVTVRSVRYPPRQALARALAAGAPLDPSETDRNTEHWSFHADDGTELPVWTVKGTGDGPVTVLIHEWGHSRLDWLPFVDEWLAESSQVVVPDLRGHGDASGFCTLGRLEAEDLVGLIKSLDEEPVRLVGCGFGANIAIRTANMVPDEIHEVVAINPWPTDVNGILNRLCMSGMHVRPPIAVFATGLRWLGTNGLQISSLQSGPRVSLQLHDGEDPAAILSALGRDDVTIMSAGTSSN